MTTAIEATGDGLIWKVVDNGETIASGHAPTMEEAQSSADAAIAALKRGRSK